jgi:hypothetical protein
MKRAANVAYAERFKRRDRKARRRLRRLRVEARELAWLAAMEIPREKGRPLAAGGKAA